MPSSDRSRSRTRALGGGGAAAAALVVALFAGGGAAGAQTQPRGFAVERLYRSAPGGGWLVMDALDMHGGLGGAMSLGVGYASNPFRANDGVARLAVVADEALADFGFALTYRRWRFYADFDGPLVISGQSGTLDAYRFTAPSVTAASRPDTVTDERLGTDVRIVGGPRSRFRLGAGAQLYVPNGNRADYDSDGTFRGMIRVLFAGDVGIFTYAGQLGVHLRPLDDSPAPGSPRGSELVFGVAGGARLPVGRQRGWAVIVGPELFGASALRAFFDPAATPFEALVSGRLEGTRDDRVQLRVKLGVGAGLNHRFGAAEWRVVAGVELFGQRSVRPAQR